MNKGKVIRISQDSCDMIDKIRSIIPKFTGCEYLKYCDLSDSKLIEGALHFYLDSWEYSDMEYSDISDKEDHS